MRSYKITPMLRATLIGAVISLSMAWMSAARAATLAGNEVALLPARGWEGIGGSNYVATDFGLLLPAVVQGLGFSAWSDTSSPATVASIDWFIFSEIGVPDSVIASGNASDFNLLLPAVTDPGSNLTLFKFNVGIPPVLLLPAVKNYVAFHVNFEPGSEGRSFLWASASDGEEAGIEVVPVVGGVPFVRQLGNAPDGTGDSGFLFEISGTSIAETPLPAAFPLFATGLGALGLFAYRRRQKQGG